MESFRRRNERTCTNDERASEGGRGRRNARLLGTFHRYAGATQRRCRHSAEATERTESSLQRELGHSTVLVGRKDIIPCVRQAGRQAAGKPVYP